MTYDDGFMWNFQTCSILIFRAGQSVNSMFPPHKATWDELTKGCREQYGPEITPRPWELVEMWGFDDLVHKANASRILFTNGDQDMWSGGSYREDLSNDLLALNFENGAHHSDLRHVLPSEDDTEDIRRGHAQIKQILGTWIDEVKRESKTE